MQWTKGGLSVDNYDDFNLRNFIADQIEDTTLPCGCGKITIRLDSLEADDIIKWLREDIPIYHMGMLGCCEDIRCFNCEDMPSECNCGDYLSWREGEEE